MSLAERLCAIFAPPQDCNDQDAERGKPDDPPGQSIVSVTKQEFRQSQERTAFEGYQEREQEPSTSVSVSEIGRNVQGDMRINRVLVMRWSGRYGAVRQRGLPILPLMRSGKTTSSAEAFLRLDDCATVCAVHGETLRHLILAVTLRIMPTQPARF